MKKIKRVLFSIYQIGGGGAERVSTLLATELAEQGYDVHFIVYERREREYYLSPKVNIHLLPGRKKGEPSPVYKLKKLLYLRKLIKDIAPDVIMPFLSYQVEHCYYASRGLGIPFISTVRNNITTDLPKPGDYENRLKIASKTEGIFLQTEAQRAYFPDDLQGKCFVIPNPVAQDILDTEYRPREEIRRFVSVGRLTPQKNHELLIRAFAEAHEVRQDISLDIYGVGPLEDKLKEVIRELGIEGTVTLKGWTKDTGKTLSEYDAFVLSSDYEGMPNALMEAMAAGLPCISTDCPTGPADLLGDNERGILVPLSDVGAMAKAVCELSDDYVFANKLGLNAKKHMSDNYSVKMIADRLIESIEKMI